MLAGVAPMMRAVAESGIPLDPWQPCQASASSGSWQAAFKQIKAKLRKPLPQAALKRPAATSEEKPMKRPAATSKAAPLGKFSRQATRHWTGF